MTAARGKARGKPEGKGRAASGRTLAERIVPRLRPVAAAQRKARIAELTAAAAEAKGGEALIAALARPEIAAFIASVMDCAPFLRSLILDDPARLAKLLSADPAARMRRLTATVRRAWKSDDAGMLMAALRHGRQETALLTALADLGGVWDVVQVTTALTAFAEAAVETAARFVLAETAANGKITLANPEAPEEGSGWIVLGMGKFGAGELNYSSDIDLIVLYDEERARLGEDIEPTTLFVRMTQRLVALLQEHTADGYVFRTDLRLRPDPGSTNIAISTEAALQYYESLGQNWERAALIKARPVAGDGQAGDAFLAELTPYIWRKYLDFAAIADIHSIKRQIHDHRGHAVVAVAGHNIKLGRGGIREIEFFVQTQQLIAGGRQPELRGRRTLDMLKGLAKFGWIDDATRDELTAAYGELRAVEHCLQMINDAQTHTLPDEPQGLAVIARMAGYRNAQAFEKAMARTLTMVRDRYAALFETAPSLTSSIGSLSFTGDADDPETLATLTALGYRNPAEISHTVRGWHFGRYPATRSASARERLTEFVPVLLEALAGGEGADAAFIAFDRFLSRMPAGVQLISLLQTNKGLLNLLVTVLAAAPRLAETIVRRAHVMDALLDPAFFGSVPDAKLLRQRLVESLAEARGFEDVLDRARIFGQEQQFLIGVRVLADTISVRQAGYAYSDLADVLLSAVFDATLREFERVHGRMKKGAVALIAMGKLGGREMSATSDVDLILLYDFDEGGAAIKRRAPAARLAILHEADAAAGGRAFRADRRGHALFGRFPPASLGQVRAAGHPCRCLRRLSGQGRLDLGAHGADPRPRRCRRPQADQARRRMHPLHPDNPPRQGEDHRRYPRDAGDGRRGEGRRRRLGSQAGTGRAGRCRIHCPVAAAGECPPPAATDLDRDRGGAHRGGGKPPAQADRCRHPFTGAEALSGADPDHPPLPRRAVRPGHGAACAARPAGAGRRTARFRHPRRPCPCHPGGGAPGLRAAYRNSAGKPVGVV